MRGRDGVDRAVGATCGLAATLSDASALADPKLPEAAVKAEANRGRRVAHPSSTTDGRPPP